MRSRLTPLGTLCFGLPLLTVALCMAADLLCHWTRQLTRSELQDISGTVQRATGVRGSRAGVRSQFLPPDFTCLTLTGWSHPFRFETNLDTDPLATLAPGTPLRISLAPDALAHPRSTHFGLTTLGAITFHPALLATLPDGRIIDALTPHNALMRSNLHIMPRASPLLALLAVLLSTRWFWRLFAPPRAAPPQTAPVPPAQAPMSPHLQVLIIGSYTLTLPFMWRLAFSEPHTRRAHGAAATTTPSSSPAAPTPPKPPASAIA